VVRDPVFGPLLGPGEACRVEAPVQQRAQGDRAGRRRPQEDEEEGIEPALQIPRQSVRAPLRREPG
jgi:hypothetical protein